MMMTVFMKLVVMVLGDLARRSNNIFNLLGVATYIFLYLFLCLIKVLSIILSLYLVLIFIFIILYIIKQIVLFIISLLKLPRFWYILLTLFVLYKIIRNISYIFSTILTTLVSLIPYFVLFIILIWVIKLSICIQKAYFSNESVIFTDNEYEHMDKVIGLSVLTVFFITIFASFAYFGPVFPQYNLVNDLKLDWVESICSGMPDYFNVHTIERVPLTSIQLGWNDITSGSVYFFLNDMGQFEIGDILVDCPVPLTYHPSNIFNVHLANVLFEIRELGYREWYCPHVPTPNDLFHFHNPFPVFSNNVVLTNEAIPSRLFDPEVLQRLVLRIRYAAYIEEFKEVFELDNNYLSNKMLDTLALAVPDDVD